MLHAGRGGQLGRDRAALTDLTHEHDVVGGDRLLGPRDDLAERRQGRRRDVIAGVLPRFADVDDLQLTAGNAVAGGLG